MNGDHHYSVLTAKQAKFYKRYSLGDWT